MSVLAPATKATTDVDAVAALGAHEVASQLSVVLGRPLIAAMMNVSATRVVRKWEEGGGITADRENALHTALQAVLILKTQFENGVVRNWFVGHNVALKDQAPGELIREIANGELLDPRIQELGRALLAAARAFVAR